MFYTSTRGGGEPLSAAEAILQGLAVDGGLLVPETFPLYFPVDLAEKPYQQLAMEIFSLYLTDFTSREIEQVVNGAYQLIAFPDGPAPCSFLENGPTILELWHGPTSAFKDMALQVLPRLMSVARKKAGIQQEIVILVATSGDTGKAALEGFKDVDGIRIIVFYPAGGVSSIPELQMVTTGGKNTAVVGVDGNFDDCQNGVKAIFSGEPFARFSSANSINWGRLLPQIVYYFYAYGQMVNQGRISMGQPIDICVPTGNFGNILAGCYAQRMGLPVGRFICASNENNVLTEALRDGLYDCRRPFYRTDSPSMDILVSSNFERFLYLCSGNDPVYTAQLFAQLKEDGFYQVAQNVRAAWNDRMTADWADQKETAAAIFNVWQQYHYLLDPHTAVAYAVSEKMSSSSPGCPRLIVSTASPYKFPGYVLQSLGKDINGVDEMDLPRLLHQCSGIPIPPNIGELEALPIRHKLRCKVAQMPWMVRQILAS